MKKIKHAIYVKTCDGNKDILMFHVRKIDDRIYITFEKNSKIIAQRPMDDILREIYSILWVA